MITPTHEMGAEPKEGHAPETGNPGGDHDPGLDHGGPAASGAYSECPPAITIPTREGERGSDVEEDGLSAETARKFNKSGHPVVTSTLSKMETVDDGLDIPSFLRRVVVAPASPAQLDEREGAAT